MVTRQQAWKYGKEWEDVMMKIHQDYFKGEIKKASRKEDMFNHIDFWWRKDSNSPWISYDIKALKRARRSTSPLDGTIHWIEVLNVRGNPGWIYGKEDFVIFATEETAIYVQTNKLPPYIEAKIKGKELVYDTPYDFYIPYRRNGSRDIIVKVPTSDLRKLADFEIKLKI
jgi:hypothetical protein